MIGIEPASLSTAPVGTKGGNQRVRRLRCVSDGKSTLGDNGGVHQAEWSSPSQNRAELSMDIEPPSLSTAPVGTEGGDQRVQNSGMYVYICTLNGGRTTETNNTQASKQVTRAHPYSPRCLMGKRRRHKDIGASANVFKKSLSLSFK